MLICPFYNGSGCGNQLANFVTIKTLALDKGYDFGVAFPERFKGQSFMKLDMGKSVIGLEVPIEGKPPTSLPEGISNYYEEAGKLHFQQGRGVDIRGYDGLLRLVPDNTVIHGLLQGEGYFEHRKDEVKKWLAVEPLELDADLCILAFRGGEYKYFPDFYLKAHYWHDAMENMRMMNPYVEFEIVTDDIEAAKEMLPGIPVSHEISMDYRKIHSARYLILSNSTFNWFPAWTSDKLRYCIYPKYYGRHNVSDGYWCLKTNITKGWWAQDREGELFTYKECQEELKKYESNPHEL